MTTYRLSELISPAFFSPHRAIRCGEIQELLAKGGRGSGKSSFISIEFILLLLKNPMVNGAVLRKVGNTLRTSVFAQLCWAIGELGLSSRFRCTVSPLEITYLKTRQKILFFGLDDPGKLKSVKVSHGYVGIVWFEELDQFSGEEEVRSAEQSLFRGGPFSFAFKSFNPPAAARNWANRYALEQREGRLVHHSTYLTVPQGWLGEKFLADAEYLKQTNETAYRCEYLGEAVGTGTAIFGNVRAERISEEQLQGFDRRLYGVDWGFYPDPWAFNGVFFDAARRILYIFDELTARRMGNRETAELLLERGIGGNVLITADSAEPKSIADYRKFGLSCRAAEKGPGSVEYSHKWLQSLSAIVIDPVRCPDSCREFSEYEYERDRLTGEVLSGYPDYDNHHIDAVRYAAEQIWRRRGG